MLVSLGIIDGDWLTGGWGTGAGQELSALYSIADVLVITPIRDGMNIVPFEYVVSRECKRLLATVILSEFAGCARCVRERG